MTDLAQLAAVNLVLLVAIIWLAAGMKRGAMKAGAALVMFQALVNAIALGYGL